MKHSALSVLPALAFLTVSVVSAQEPTATANTAWENPLFEFRSGMWLNLHHFLHQQGAVAHIPEGPDRRPDATLVPTSALSPEELEIWEQAVAFYGASVSGRSPLMDPGMRAIKRTLIVLPDDADITETDIEADVRGALARVAPVYARHWWPEHAKHHDEWVRAVLPLVREHGPTLRRRLVALYGSEWPGRMHVDLSVDATWYGAYATINPTHVTISTCESDHQGWMALEVLCHEASHALIHDVSETIDRICADRQHDPPHQLWHAVIFYTAGEVVRDLAGEDYRPYAEVNGLWARAWPGVREALAESWRPYMQGKIERDLALVAVVDLLSD